MSLDGAAIAKACGMPQPMDVHTHLCRSQLEAFKDAASAGETLVVACTQEAPFFRETLEETAPDTPAAFVNIRERAGWSDEGRDATAKIAALLAEATLDIPAAPTVSLTSEGTCLVYGKDETAIAIAQQLADRLDVTVLISGEADVIPPRAMTVPIFHGRIAQASGHLGAFDITVDDYAAYRVSSRGALSFDPPQNGVRSSCDIIIDITGGDPLFPAHEKRDGYLRPDPANPGAVQRALFEGADLLGEFEKPRYVIYDAGLCAHGRSGIDGCTLCLDACPASAIVSAGDTVEIDPFVCGGCGACNSVCPTGAASYTMPPTTALLDRARTVLGAYRSAGGVDTVLLVHDERHGEELIHLSARFGAGLPANVLPFAVREVTQLGLDFLLGALAYGAARIVVLVPPERRDEQDGLAQQVATAEAILSGLSYDGPRLDLWEIDDPDALDRELRGLGGLTPMPAGAFLPMGNKRGLMRLALGQLHEAAPGPVNLFDLPDGSPFGAVEIDVDGCTVCLACVGACPTGALQDNPDAPMLRFQEEACVQCGLCRGTCPERVITLHPRLNFTDEARRPIVLKEEEPFACIRCGTPFGTKSSVERIVSRLADKHSMFQDGKMVDLIQMCQDCRVEAQMEMEDSPLAGAARPRTRTTDDYLEQERREIEAARARFEADKDGGDEEP